MGQSTLWKAVRIFRRFENALINERLDRFFVIGRSRAHLGSFSYSRDGFS
jgi:hypothetical protein